MDLSHLSDDDLLAAIEARTDDVNAGKAAEAERKALMAEGARRGLNRALIGACAGVVPSAVSKTKQREADREAHERGIRLLAESELGRNLPHR